MLKMVMISLIIAISSCSKNDDDSDSGQNNNPSDIEIGDFRDGGIVFWIDPENNGHGLVCAINDQSDGAEWGCNSTEVMGAWGKTIGKGNQNTEAIIANCTTGNTAADIAYNFTFNGYDDWFLPSKDELNEIEVNRVKINKVAQANGGTAFTLNYYWSSTQYTNIPQYAYCQELNNGVSAFNDKYHEYAVRCVRAF